MQAKGVKSISAMKNIWRLSASRSLTVRFASKPWFYQLLHPVVMHFAFLASRNHSNTNSLALFVGKISQIRISKNALWLKASSKEQFLEVRLRIRINMSKGWVPSRRKIKKEGLPKIYQMEISLISTWQDHGMKGRSSISNKKEEK